MSNPFLSIVIPAHNEASRLPPSLEKINCFLGQQDFTAEVIIVENGSRDRTYEIALEAARASAHIRVIQSPDGIRGKGLAVKQGMLAAKGDWRFICDADLSMRIDDLPAFLPPETTGYDIVIASREAPGAVRVDEPEYRHIMGPGRYFHHQAYGDPRLRRHAVRIQAFQRRSGARLIPGAAHERHRL